MERTEGSGVAVALLLLVQTLPRLLGPLAGTVADRFDRRTILIACDGAQAVVLTTIALLTPSFGILLVLVGLSALLATVFAPTSRSAIPSLVAPADVMAANTWLGFVFNLQFALGPALGGVLFAEFGLRGALLVDAGTFVGSALLLRRLPRLAVGPTGAPTESYLRAAREGLSYARRHRVARAVTLTLFLGLIFAALDNVALVFLARDALQAGPAGYGILTSGFGAGMVIGSFVLLAFQRRLKAGGVFLWGWVMTGVGTLFTGLSPALAPAIAMQAIAGIGNAAENAAGDTLLQRTVPSEMLGRVFGLETTAAYLGGGLAYAFGGILLDLTSARAVFVVAGAGTLCVWLIARVMLPPGAGDEPLEPTDHDEAT